MERRGSNLACWKIAAGQLAGAIVIELKYADCLGRRKCLFRLADICETLVKGELDVAQFPYSGNSRPRGGYGPRVERGLDTGRVATANPGHYPNYRTAEPRYFHLGLG